MTPPTTKGRFPGPVPNRNFYEDDKVDFPSFEPFPGAAPRSYPPGEELKVMNINMCKETNAASHFTTEYHTQNLVVRRGQQFVLEATFNRPLTPQDDIQAEFLIGSDPAVNRGSHVMVSFGNRAGGPWIGQILAQQGAVVTLGITPDAKAIFGLYRTYVGISMGNGMERTQKDNSTNIYVVFNPWCPDDDVYYPDEAGRQEYVLNTTGIIYQGSVGALAERSWVYGQFDEGILDACIYVLDVCRMPIDNRNNVLNIVRAASAAINSQDDQGVLVGNWSDDYSMGTPPTTWTGSIRILQQFHGSGNPVCYAQCWVFAGVLCTFLRSIGIAARVITNFNSAHDNTGNLKTELIFTADGAPDRRNTRDSIWNYHCWVDCYLKRNDLPPKYSGWQALDATPQETSDGYYRCGPAPVIAIKDGEVCHPFDCGFVFAEVNSDVVYLKRDKYGNLSPFKVDSSCVGELICTKAIGAFASEEITHQYKHPEGSDLEQKAKAAAEAFGCERDSSEIPVSLLSVIISVEPVPLGGSVKVMVTFKNQSSVHKTVTAHIDVSVIFYTGVTSKSFKEEEFTIQVPPQQQNVAMFEIPPQEYMQHLGSQSSLQFVVSAHTDSEEMSDVKIIHLKTPDLTITISGYQQVNRETFATVSFRNPFNMPLINARLSIEGAGVLNYRVYPYNTIAPYAEIVQKVGFIPVRPGPKTIVAILDSDNITDIQGMIEFNVAG